jgi:hypothetical protein
VQAAGGSVGGAACGYFVSRGRIGSSSDRIKWPLKYRKQKHCKMKIEKCKLQILKAVLPLVEISISSEANLKFSFCNFQFSISQVSNCLASIEE